MFTRGAKGLGVPRDRRRRALPAEVRRQSRHHDVGGASHRGAPRNGSAPWSPAERSHERRPLYIQDVTLRDGMHAIRHQYSVGRWRGSRRRSIAPASTRSRSATAMGWPGRASTTDSARTPIVEWIEAVVRSVKRAKVTVLLLPGIGTIEDLDAAHGAGAQSVRIATHSTEADIAQQHIEHARKLGMDVAGFLMMAHMTPPAELARQAKLMESYGAHCVYIVDSAGALLPQGVVERMQAFNDVLDPATRRACTRITICRSAWRTHWWRSSMARRAWTDRSPAWAPAPATRRSRC